MGCFLVITPKDLGQLSRTMKAGVSVISHSSDGLAKIQVNSTMQYNARQMAAAIREHASSAQVTSVTSQEASRAIPTKERIGHNVAAYSSVHPGLVAGYLMHLNIQLRSVRPIVNREAGKAGEEVAARILRDTGYLAGDENDVKGTKAQGFDLLGRNRIGNTVVVEVKTSTQDKPFGEMLDTGRYKKHDPTDIGFRQASNGWISAVSEIKDIDIDLSNLTVLGVRIDPIKERVFIYRRATSDASQWKLLMSMSLAEYNA